MFVKTRKTAFYTMLLGILFAFSAQLALGQEGTRPRRVSKATSVHSVPSGQQVTLEGNVTKVGENSFSICDMAGAETIVQLTNATRITTHRRGIFRGAATHNKSSLLVGLTVSVRGRGNEAGELEA